MNNTRWIYKENEIKEDLKSLNLDNDILNILINRKIDSVEKINNFFNNDLDNIISPFSLKDVDKTILRLLEAINNEELIYIYGDYDVDGITSTSIAYLALKSLGAKVDYYIPLRDEGYGLNIDAISSLKEKGAKIIISVDCGITSIKEARHAKEIGLDLIITDHHEIIGELPNAYAIINPKRKDQDYSFEYLAGCGTIFLLLVALFEHLEKRQEMYTGNAQYKKDCGIASAVFCLLLPVRQGQPPRYYPIRRAAPQGFRPEPVPESRPGASWRAPRSQGHAPEVPWRPSKFRCCSLRRAPCPWRA